MRDRPAQRAGRGREKTNGHLEVAAMTGQGVEGRDGEALMLQPLAGIDDLERRRAGITCRVGRSGECVEDVWQRLRRRITGLDESRRCPFERPQGPFLWGFLGRQLALRDPLMDALMQDLLAPPDAILQGQVAEPAPEGHPVGHTGQCLELTERLELAAGDRSCGAVRIGEAMGKDMERHCLGPFLS